MRRPLSDGYWMLSLSIIDLFQHAPSFLYQMTSVTPVVEDASVGRFDLTFHLYVMDVIESFVHRDF